ncbi:hypothetical protein B0J14DRAFT_493782, partial [Halenospora varia]
AFPHVLQNHPPMFTHGDFQRKNIIAMKAVPLVGELSGNVEGDFELTIVDWETVGWYPSYWEYSKAIFACGRRADDWDY